MRVFLLLIIGLSLVSSPLSAQEAPASATLEPLNTRGTYYFAFNHIPFAKLWLATETEEESFKVTSTLKSQGIVRLFKRIKNLTIGEGRRNDGQWVPFSYVSNSDKEEREAKHVELHYDGFGNLTKRIVNPDDDPNYRPRVPAQEAAKIMHPSGAVLTIREKLFHALHVGASTFTQRIYDARRLVDLHLVIEGRETLRINGETLPVIKTRGSREYIAGYTDKEIRRVKDDPPVYIYFSDDARMIPVFVQTSLDWGTLTATYEAE